MLSKSSSTEPEADPRRFSDAAARNAGPLVTALRRLLPETGAALEIASGSGQHAGRFAQAFPGWHWQPSEADGAAFASIRAWAIDAGVSNVGDPLLVDVAREPWPLGAARYDAIFCANLLHIAPEEATSALMRGAARHLRPNGQLLIYGPFWIEGIAAAPSNLAFDRSLRARDPAWGVRSLAAVADAGRSVGLDLVERIDMPANNQLLVFRPQAAGRCAAGSP